MGIFKLILIPFAILFFIVKIVMVVLGLGAIAAIVIISLSDVIRSLQSHKVNHDDIGRLIKRHIADGKFRVTAQVLSPRSISILPAKIQYEEIFTGELDSSLKSRFGDRDRIEISI